MWVIPTPHLVYLKQAERLRDTERGVYPNQSMRSKDKQTWDVCVYIGDVSIGVPERYDYLDRDICEGGGGKT